MDTQNDTSKTGFTFKRRVPITSVRDLVVTEPPLGDAALPVKILASSQQVDILGWAKMARNEIETLLLRHGAILFRGFGIKSESEFQDFIQVVSGDPLPYVERSSPRSQVRGNIYTSTDYPSEHPIFLHCENSYQRYWPLRIFFYCHVQPEQGGETPIAATRRILERIDPSVRDVFAKKGVLYVRNFGVGPGLSWRTVFQADSRDAVEEYCKDAGIECIWHRDDRLETRHVRKAIRKHPRTGDDVWFNHAAFFHISTLDPETQKALGSALDAGELPNNTYYGDGTSIEPDVLDHLRDAYAKETVCFPWLQGDVLMMDNMLAAHGRSPYRGARKILVGMTEPCTD